MRHNPPYSLDTNIGLDISSTLGKLDPLRVQFLFHETAIMKGFARKNEGKSQDQIVYGVKRDNRHTSHFQLIMYIYVYKKSFVV